MEKMDIEGGFVFDRLPRDLSEKFFAHLPISSVFKCRCVCKRLNALLTSNSFLEVWAQFSPQKSWFLMYHSERTIVSYLPGSNRWNNLLLPDQFSLDFKPSALIASSGGLLCFDNQACFGNSSPCFLIYNPVSASYRVLPSLPQIRYRHIVGMFTDKVTGFYKIMVTGTSERARRYSDETESITEVFDSRTGIWEHHHRSHHKFLLFSSQVKAIWHEGLFYVLSNQRHCNSFLEGCRLIAYDMNKREWIDFNVREPSADIKHSSLFIYGGKLHMFGRYLRESFRILMLSMETLQWVKVEEREHEFFKGLSSSVYLRFVYLRFNDHGVLLSFRGNQGWQYVMYNLPERTWYQLPQDDDSCPQRLIDERKGYFVGLVYEPSLSAKV